ncbi:MAG TPA: cellulose binding domain-containing protein [Polyangiaceae bacterium]|nr:cellulose binding domain-containing protein [Polyangiaceae bacterium]
MSNLRNVLFAGLALVANACAVSTGDSGEQVGAQTDALTGNGALQIQSDWGNGYCAVVTLTNGLTASTTNWQAAIDLKGSTITSSYSANFPGKTGVITVTPVNYNTAIQPNQSIQFGFCASAPNASARPVMIGWNMKSGAYATCNQNSGLNPTKAALAVAMATELGRWAPNTDLTMSGGQVVLSAAGLAACQNGCANTVAMLGQQNANATADQNVFNPTVFNSDLQASFGRQTNLITNLRQNSPSQLPPDHKLTLVGGPLSLGSGNCGPHYVYQVDDKNGNPLTTAQAQAMQNALCFYGQGNCGQNPYIAFTTTQAQCPAGRTCLAIDPADGDNTSTSTTTAGSAPSYPMNRVYDPTNSLLNSVCVTTTGKVTKLVSKCSTQPNTCGYLYCM